MKAGPRDRLIVIERKTSVLNDYGEPVETWASWSPVYAAVYYGSGSEQRAAAQTQAAQTASFEVLASEKTRAVTPLDRVNFDGALWDIQAVHPLDRDGVRITATKSN